MAASTSGDPDNTLTRPELENRPLHLDRYRSGAGETEMRDVIHRCRVSLSRRGSGGSCDDSRGNDGPPCRRAKIGAHGRDKGFVAFEGFRTVKTVIQYHGR
jgi:hypothetical protein